jgi:hypothetical protein
MIHEVVPEHQRMECVVKTNMGQKRTATVDLAVIGDGRKIKCSIISVSRTISLRCLIHHHRHRKRCSFLSAVLVVVGSPGPWRLETGSGRHASSMRAF